MEIIYYPSMCPPWKQDPKPRGNKTSPSPLPPNRWQSVFCWIPHQPPSDIPKHASIHAVSVPLSPGQPRATGRAAAQSPGLVSLSRGNRSSGLHGKAGCSLGQLCVGGSGSGHHRRLGLPFHGDLCTLEPFPSEHQQDDPARPATSDPGGDSLRGAGAATVAVVPPACSSRCGPSAGTCLPPAAAFALPCSHHACRLGAAQGLHAMGRPNLPKTRPAARAWPAHLPAALQPASPCLSHLGNVASAWPTAEALSLAWAWLLTAPLALSHSPPQPGVALRPRGARARQHVVPRPLRPPATPPGKSTSSDIQARLSGRNRNEDVFHATFLVPKASRGWRGRAGVCVCVARRGGVGAGGSLSAPRPSVQCSE